MQRTDNFSDRAQSASDLVELLQRQAEKLPDNIVFTFLKDGEQEDGHLTFKQLDSAARSLAAHLQDRGASGERALLLYPAGLDYIKAFFGCLYAGVVAVPAYPPRQNQNLVRLKAIMADAKAAYVLSAGTVHVRLRAELEQDASFRDVCLIDSDNLAAAETAWRRPDISASDIAFLQYTSGSTGAPKGVVLTHHNLVSNSASIATALNYHEGETTGVSWLPLYHDMGLIGGLLQPVYAGYRGVLMSPAAFLQRPFRWLKAISDYKAFISAGPDFAYDFCARRVSAEQLATLSLDSWRIALSGAEPVRHSTLQRFTDIFEPTGFSGRAFHPCYGLAEATLMVSGARANDSFASRKVNDKALQENRVVPADNDESGRWLVGCGASAAEQQVAIVDPVTSRRCAANEIGEIWVAGESIAQGYWHNALVTAETFQARIAESGEGPFLRTGDLGFLDGEELFVTGRIKDLIIIRGRNHYPQDIEATAEHAVAALRTGACAAFAMDNGKAERLAVVLEAASRPAFTEENVQHIRTAIAEAHELEIGTLLVVPLGAIPKTSSGKIQRRACREKYLHGELEVTSCWEGASFDEITSASPGDVVAGTKVSAEDVEAWLVQQLAKRLSIPEESIRKHESLSVYYLDSLAAVELSHGIEKRFGAHVALENILAGLSISELARLAVAGDNVVTPHGLPGPLPLSFGQQRLWFIWQLDPQSFTYNIFDAYRVRGEFDVPVFQRCFDILVKRHEILRTRFVETPSGPVQMVGEALEIPFELCDLTGARSGAARELDLMIADETRRPFDLATGPLLRLMAYRVGQDEHVILLTLHHIVADGWSAQILIRELASLYGALTAGREAALPKLPLQYSDFAVWQDRWLSDRLAPQLAYWKARLADADMVLQLPTDKSRPAVQRVAGAKCSALLDKALVSKLQGFSQAQGATLFMTYLAAIQAVLHRYTGQSDILVGTPISGRHRGEFESIVGFFINTLVMRASVSGSKRFSELLQQVRGSVLEAYAHQDLPFHRLVEELKVPRDLSRSPVFQVSFTYHNLKSEQLSLGNLALESYDIDNNTTNFDLGISMVECEAGTQCTIRYKTDLFEADSIERLLMHFQNFLTGVARDPEQTISRIPLLAPYEKQMLVQDWNATSVSFDADTHIHQSFEIQAKVRPDTTALVFESGAISYGELNERANRLSHYLIALEVGPESRVGVAMERSIEMVVSLLAVLKAGAAYVPLDPNYPAERLRYMLEDSAVRVLLTQAALQERFAQDGLHILAVDRDWPRIAQGPAHNPDIFVSGKNLAYVIYTSGSTGLPKGAMNTHEAIRNRLQWMQSEYLLDNNDCVLQKTPFSFDVSVWEFFWPLMNGARLVIAKPRGHMDPDYLVRLIAEEKVTTLHFVPSMLQVFLESADLYRCAALKRVICSGEALSVALNKRFFERCSAQLHNLYGPTEAAVDVTYWQCLPGQQLRIPIGKPIANIGMYVLDTAMQAVPIGVAGEIHIGGVGLARGYWNRPDLTAEKFVPNPFSADGERLYKTGDLGRYLPDGNIEYLGRLDFQVKIRGFRIELGELETALLTHPAIKEAVALVKDHGNGDGRLVAAVVPDWTNLKETTAVLDQLEEAQLDQWQSLYEEKYAQPAEGDAQFNIVSWDSSYTGEPIDADDMHSWVDTTITRIRALRSRRVLEIGCGTGLMLFRLASECDEYCGTDFSREALAHVASNLDATLASKTRLLQRHADNFTDFNAEHFDSVVLNSVIQYFPDVEYLTDVLGGAIKATRHGGHIFVGDVRNLQLLEMFHASVQLHHASPDTSNSQVLLRMARQVQQEKELVVDPAFFLGLKKIFPRIGRVQILLKDGAYRNELSKFRYDVILHLDVVPQPGSEGWMDWPTGAGVGASVAPALAALLADEEVVRIRNIPNARLETDIALLRALRTADESAAVEPLRRQQAHSSTGIDPADLVRAAAQAGYQCELSWIGCSDSGAYHAMFWRAGSGFVADFSALEDVASADRPAAEFANQPLHGQLAQRLPGELSKFLAGRLPDHMVPAIFHVLEKLPLSVNGKIDRRALEKLGSEQQGSRVFVAPRNFIEESIAAIWTEVMSIERVGVDDNFFELGGHSLLLTQIASRIRSAFHVEIPLMVLFDAPTIASMASAVAAQIEQEHAGELDDMIDELKALSPEEIQRLLDEDEVTD